MVKSPIAETQELPQEILDAAVQKNLVIFIGAGASRIIGCKGWEELSHNLINICFETPKKNPFEGSLITYKEKDSLTKIEDPKKIITICKKILEKNGYPEKFVQILNDSLKGKEDLIQLHDIYKEIFGIQAVFITTNVDIHLHKQFDPTLDLAKIVYKETDFNPHRIELSKIYQIHGTILKPESMVFTTSDYLIRYNDKSKIKTFLEEIFKNYVVLFIGYGLSEFEILDFLVLKTETSENREAILKKRRGKYIVLPFFTGEENIRELMEYYYNDLGVEVIPYAIDKKGYDQLYELIKDWNSQIRSNTPLIIDLNKNTDKILNNFSPEKARDLFGLLRSNSPQERYFLSQLGKIKNPTDWFDLLKQNGYFNPKNNPTGIEASRHSWLILDYFENYARYIIAHPREGGISSLLEIINSIIFYKDEAGKSVENDYTDYRLFCIVFLLPQEKISDKYFEYFKDRLKYQNSRILISSEISGNVLEKYISENNCKITLKLIEIVFDFNQDPNSDSGRIQSLLYDNSLQEYYLFEILEKFSDRIIQVCGETAFNVALNKVELIVASHPQVLEYYSIGSVNTASKPAQNENYPSLMVQFIGNYLIKSDSAKIRPIVNDFINREHSIFKRLALSTINHNYTELKEVFWNFKGNPFDIYEIKSELYTLIESNCTLFSIYEINKLVTWIESMDFSILSKRDIDPIEIEQYEAQSKKTWLSALEKTKNPEVLKKIEEYNKISPEEITSPIEDDMVSAHFLDISPIEEESELLKMSNEDIVKYLNNFKDEGFLKPNKRGLAGTLKSVVSSDPKKFTDNIFPFLTIQRIYISSFIRGFLDAWKLKQDINWSVLLKFINDLIQTKGFWLEKTPDEEDDYKHEIVMVVSDLIYDGTKDNKRAFNSELLPLSEKILLLLIEQNDSEISSTDNLINTVGNSPKERILSAMISYSLREAFIENEKNGKVRWNKVIKDYFTIHLDPSIDLSIDFPYILGKYLRQITFLDKAWVNENLASIFPEDNQNRWQTVMTAYLFFSPRVTKTCFHLVKESNNYSRALKFNFTENYIEEHLVWHISVAYLESEESIEDNNSLIIQLLNLRSTKKIEILIQFIWMHRKEMSNEQKKLVIDLWFKLADILKQNETDPQYKKLIVGLLKWIEYIDTFNSKTVDLLKFSTKHLVFGYEFYYIFENFIKLAQKYPNEISEIFLESVKSGNIQYHDEKKMMEFITILYKNGAKDNADKICRIFVSNGYSYLQNVCLENN